MWKIALIGTQVIYWHSNWNLKWPSKNFSGKAICHGFHGQLLPASNHPSGNAEPSPQVILILTLSVVAQGAILLGIPLLIYLILYVMAITRVWCEITTLWRSTRSVIAIEDPHFLYIPVILLSSGITFMTKNRIRQSMKDLVEVNKEEEKL